MGREIEIGIQCNVCDVPSTGKSSNSSSSSSRAVLVCVGFDVVAASAVVDLEACSFAVGFVEDILT